MEKDIFKQRRQMLADMILNNELYVPMKAKEIAMLLDIPKAKRSELMEVLDSLVADGTIGVSKKGKYMKPENVALVGTFESTSRGFGFVVIPDREDDIFVKANDTMNAFYHDKVKVVITTEKNGGKVRLLLLLSMRLRKLSEHSRRTERMVLLFPIMPRLTVIYLYRRNS